MSAEEVVTMLPTLVTLTAKFIQRCICALTQNIYLGETWLFRSHHVFLRVSVGTDSVPFTTKISSLRSEGEMCVPDYDVIRTGIIVVQILMLLLHHG